MKLELIRKLSRLRKKLRPIGEAEIGKLLQFKTKDSDNQLDVPEDLLQFHKWDLPYYANKQRKAHFSYDSSRVAEYFEVKHTITAMLDLFEKIFCMHFEHIQASVWDETVTVYSVWDSESVGGGFLGYLYIDPFRRQGKRRGNYHLSISRVSKLPSCPFSFSFSVNSPQIDNLQRDSSKQTEPNITQSQC
jgi:metallopeptidase MepB